MTLSPAVVLGALASPAAAQLAPPTIHYTLTQESAQTLGCLPPCLCPILVLPIAGGFDLTPRLIAPLDLDVYDLGNVVLTLPSQSPGGSSIALGSGVYSVSNNQLPPLHSLELLLSIDGGPPQSFRSRTSLVSPTPFPAIEIDVADNAFVCFNRVFLVRAAPDLFTPFCTATVNSSGAAAHIGVAGSSSIAANDLRVTAGPVPPSVPGVFFFGPDVAQTPFGDGFRCVGVNGLRRLSPVLGSGPAGALDLAVDNQQASGSPLFAPGTGYAFQAWFRDPAAGGAGFNLSDGAGVLMTF